MTHIDANVTEHTQKADVHLCLQPRSSGGRWGKEEEGGGGVGLGGYRRALKARTFPSFPLDNKKTPCSVKTRLSLTQLFPATQWTQQLPQGHGQDYLFFELVLRMQGTPHHHHHHLHAPPLMRPGGQSLTEGLEDAVAGLVVVLRVRPV